MWETGSEIALSLCMGMQKAGQSAGHCIARGFTHWRYTYRCCNASATPTGGVGKRDPHRFPRSLWRATLSG